MYGATGGERGNPPSTLLKKMLVEMNSCNRCNLAK
jgi:hypothetical protein